MKGTVQKLAFIGLVVALVSAAHAIGYLWLTDQEMTRFGDRIKFWHGDTLDGPVHSNSQISIMQDPVFYDRVSTTEEDFWRGAGYAPRFQGPPPIFNAPYFPIPERMEPLRECARQQGHFYSFPNEQVLVEFRQNVMRAWSWNRGLPFDSTQELTIALDGPTCVFFDCPVRIKGIVEGEVTIGSSYTIRIDDNVRYLDADSLTGRTPPTSSNYLALVSEADVKIRNTPANGRANGYNRNPGNPDSHSVVISAAILALGGSFTFENQNDPDSGYVCECQPDERGAIYVYGGIVQRQRGYLHRSNRQGTGYLHRRLRYDRRFDSHGLPGLFGFGLSFGESTDTLDFGDVPLGTTARDTADVYPSWFSHLGAAYTYYPFTAQRVPPFEGYHFRIPTSFTPPRAQPFRGFLNVTADGQYYQILLLGRGIADEPPPIRLDVSPNPFNLSTTITYSLAEAGEVKITLYDVLGRVAREINLSEPSAGEHRVQVNGAELASGVYFVSLEIGSQRMMQKVLLVK